MLGTGVTLEWKQFTLKGRLEFWMNSECGNRRQDWFPLASLLGLRVTNALLCSQMTFLLFLHNSCSCLLQCHVHIGVSLACDLISIFTSLNTISPNTLHYQVQVQVQVSLAKYNIRGSHKTKLFLFHKSLLEGDKFPNNNSES